MDMQLALNTKDIELSDVTQFNDPYAVRLNVSTPRKVASVSFKDQRVLIDMVGNESLWLSIPPMIDEGKQVIVIQIDHEIRLSRMTFRYTCVIEASFKVSVR